MAPTFVLLDPVVEASVGEDDEAGFVAAAALPVVTDPEPVIVLPLPDAAVALLPDPVVALLPGPVVALLPEPACKLLEPAVALVGSAGIAGNAVPEKEPRLNELPAVGHEFALKVLALPNGVALASADEKAVKSCNSETLLPLIETRPKLLES